MWRDFWALALPYWTGDERWDALRLGGLTAVISLGSTYILTRTTAAQGDYGNALQDKNAPAFYHAMAVWLLWVALWVLGAVFSNYYNQLLALRWRQWMTRRFLEKWLAHRTYYYWRFAGLASDNPDQRISEDVRDFVNMSLMLVGNVFGSFPILVTYSIILWRLSAGLTLPVAGHSVTIPGYLVWVSLLWAAGFTWVTLRVGKPLVPLSFQRQRFEADFRYGLVRVREHAESIALSRGEGAERQRLLGQFGSLARTIRAILSRDRGVNAISYINDNAGRSLHYLLAAPLYFHGLIKIGGLFKIGSSFAYVQGALAFVVSSYLEIATWMAVIQRLADFAHTADAARDIVEAQPLTGRGDIGESSLRVTSLTLRTPNGRQIAADLNVVLSPGDALLVTGPSGAGKSTLLRAIAGLWPFTDGAVTLPANFDATDGMMILPQQPYLPIGTLRAALTYPADPSTLTNLHWADLLRQVRLDGLLTRLDDNTDWSHILSGGEQQRVALARVFVHQPHWLFLDEATSALDEATETGIYSAIRAVLPDTAILSIGHRGSLAPLHDRQITLPSPPEA